MTVDYFDRFLARNRAALVTVLDRQLAARGHRTPVLEAPPDLWSASQRTAANLAAMRVAAAKRPNEMTDDDRRALAAYSGWGGLSIDGASKQFPLGFPAPEPRGLIHEYYTPTKVAREVARVIRPLVDDLPDDEGVVLALEPSAGIGRFVQAASGDGFDPLHWLLVEWSELSARMLQALRPEIPVYNGPFERWVREHGPEYAGRLGLILANPPYGARGVSITEDPDRGYREKNAYAYFLRRALDLLAPNGLGVFLVPSGFLTGASAGLVGLREKVLKRHHLSAAYRLPSAIFPGAMLVTDLLFFRARGGELDQVDEGDRFVLEGRYFREHPHHVLGTEVGKDAGDDDQTAKPRWGYQVVGTFERLPELVERPICGACTIARDVIPFPARPAKAGLARRLEDAAAGLSEHAATAVALGLRVDRYLAAASAQTSDEHVQLWPELHEALTAWSAKHGSPWASADLLKLAKEGRAGVKRFLQAFTKTGALIAGFSTKPTWTPRYSGKSDDLVALAEWVYRTKRRLTTVELSDALVEHSGGTADRAKATVADRLHELLDAGWCVDGDAWDELGRCGSTRSVCRSASRSTGSPRRPASSPMPSSRPCWTTSPGCRLGRAGSRSISSPPGSPSRSTVTTAPSGSSAGRASSRSRASTTTASTTPTSSPPRLVHRLDQPRQDDLQAEEAERREHRRGAAQGRPGVGAGLPRLDALDGVGKTTLVSRLAAHFGGVPMDTPGLALRAVREVVLEGLGHDQLARCVFYLSTVIAEGHRARALVGCGTSVVMDRYWPSTLAYARARGVGEDLDAVVALLPRPDVSVMLTLDEEVRLCRLTGRGEVTAADRETLDPAFRDRVVRSLKATTDLEVDVTGASPDEAVDRVSRAIHARIGSAQDESQHG